MKSYLSLLARDRNNWRFREERNTSGKYQIKIRLGKVNFKKIQKIFR